MPELKINDHTPHCSKHVLPLVVGGLKITCEDNMELMSRYPDNYFDLAIVDPPYGSSGDALEKDKDNSNKHNAKRKKYHQFKNVMPTQEYFNELKRVSKNQIIWGGNFFNLSGGVIAWNKNGTAFGEGEVAICSTHKSVKFFEFTWNGMIQQDMSNKEVRIHPTQKPIQLYKWILKNYAKEGFKIIDTHLGSGSHAIAVEEMNRFEKMNLTLTACEIDKEYFTEKKQRIINHVAQQSLF